MIEQFTLNLAWGIALLAMSGLAILIFINYTYARWIRELFEGA
jgi:hypothetical protein